MTNPWDERYQIDDYYYGTEPNDFLKQNLSRFSPRGRVLTLAEGEGRNAIYLASQGYEVTAVDGSRVGLEKLKKFAKSKGVTVQAVHSDLKDYFIEPGAWDGIVSIWCHVPPVLRRTLHQQVVQGLKPSGVFLLESYHPRQLDYKTGGPPSAELMMTKENLEQELEGLTFEVLQEIDRDIHEGKGHQGKSAVTQCVGRKAHK